MNNAKLQLEVVSPTTIKCGHIQWFALDTKLVGKVKVLLEENEKLIKIKKYAEDVGNKRNELYEKIDKAIEYIEQFENIKAYYSWVEDGYEEYNYDEDFKKDLLDILRGNDEK